MVLVNRIFFLVTLYIVTTVAGEKLTINCSIVLSDYFFNTRVCIFQNVDIHSNDTDLAIDTHYEDQYIHPGLFKTIKFENSRLLIVPDALFRKFFNAERVYLNNTEITQIPSQSFVHAFNLRELYLNHNQIDLLVEEVFSPVLQASTIDLSHNLLTTINPFAFERCKQLRRLYLSYNRITNVPEDAFDLLPSLSVLKLDNNLIKQLDYSLFSSNRFIEEIDLSHNGLMELQFHFSGDRLRLIDAAANNIQKVLLKSTIETSGVAVNLSSNKLVQFCLPEKIEITVLNVENNRLGKSLIEISNITALASLRELYLGSNSLPPLEPETFSALENLKYLGIPSTELLELRHEVFLPLDQLTYLDISYNPLRIIDLRALKPLGSLTSLYINGNELNGMDLRNIKSYLPKIFEIQISDTEWNCAHLQETIAEMKNQSVYLVAHPDKYIRRRKNINGILCYGAFQNGTYSVFDEDLDRSKLDQSQSGFNFWDINWVILGASIVAGIVGIYLIIKTIIYCSSKSDDDNLDNFTEIVYTSD